METDDFVDHQWFQHWTPVINRLLEPYQDIVDDTLYPIEIQEYVEYLLCREILKSAMYHYLDAWSDAVEMLSSGHDLEDTLACLFGDETPPSVAAMSLQKILQESEEYDESYDIQVGREVMKRNLELEQLGLPKYVWVVMILGNNNMQVSLQSRDEFIDTTVSLVRVVDGQ